MEVESFDNVWDAICDTPQQAQEMTGRSELLSALTDRVRSWGVQRRTAAKRLGVARPRVTAMLRGKLGEFSLNDLVALTEAAERVPAVEHSLGKGEVET